LHLLVALTSKKFQKKFSNVGNVSLVEYNLHELGPLISTGVRLLTFTDNTKTELRHRHGRRQRKKWNTPHNLCHNAATSHTGTAATTTLSTILVDLRGVVTASSTGAAQSTGSAKSAALSTTSAAFSSLPISHLFLSLIFLSSFFSHAPIGRFAAVRMMRRSSSSRRRS
jgi:hypothetical protein